MPERTGLLSPSQMGLVGYHLHTDWGNPQVRELATRTAEWECPARIVTANGFFKAVLKCSPTETEGWFWALEWNKAVRVIGAICNTDDLPNWLRELPDLGWQHLPGGWRRRREVSLSPAEDFLVAFGADEPQQEASITG